MIPKNQRLTRQEFLQLKKHGHQLRIQNLNLIYLYSPALPLSRSKYSIVTSTKFHKSAVTRNKFRRLVYPLLVKFAPRHSLILFPNTSMLKLTHEEINSVLDKTLSSLPFST